MVYIEIYEQGKLPRQYALTGEPFVLGRSDSCDHTVKDPYISGRNTQVVLQAVVSDLGSRNGTWVGEEQIVEKAVAFGDIVKLGRDQNVAFRIGVSEGAPKTKTDAGEDGAAQGDRVAALQRELAERNLELTDVRRDLQAASARASLVDDLEGRVAELTTQLETRIRQVELLEGEIDKVVNAAVPVRESREATTAEVASLRGRIAELEAEVHTQRLAAEAQRAAPRVVASDATGLTVGDTLSWFIESGADLEPALVESVSAHPDLAANLGFALGKLYRFGRDVEKVVTRIAQEYRGAQLDQTMLPGIGGNLSRAVNGLLLKGGEERRRELDSYLQKTRVWWITCLTAPRQAVGEWYKEMLLRIAPSHIEREVSVSAIKKAVGLDADAYWKRYRSLMEDLTHDIAMDEIDRLTADLALKMAQREGVA
ncbi:MAG: FHA domain-containing protein [Planctomycetota bacterium]